MSSDVNSRRAFSSVVLLTLVILGAGQAWINGQEAAPARKSKENTITRADLAGFLVIGIQARTTNAAEATAGGVIPKQWQRFMQEGVLQKIPNKTSANIYALYTDYASDRNGEYSYVIGAMVKDGTPPPAGMAAVHVPGGRYNVLTTERGPLPKVVPEAWQQVWKLEDASKLNRLYKTDFEIYDQRSQDPQNAQVDLYVGTK